MRIDIVLVNWRQSELTIAAVRSVEAEARALGAGIIVVDNASGDGSSERLRAALPGVHVIDSGRNGGFGAGVNAGLAASTADVVVLLNNDAVARPGFLAALTEPFSPERDPRGRVGATTARILLEGEWVRVDGRAAQRRAGERVLTAADGARWRPARTGETGITLTQSTGNELDANGNGVDRDWLAPHPVAADARVQSFCGGAAALRRSCVDELGGFDETLFMYGEDLDLGLRMRRAGYAVRYVEGAVAVHRLGASAAAADFPAITRAKTRNRVLIAWRYAGLGTALRALARTIARTTIDGARAVRSRGLAGAEDAQAPLADLAGRLPHELGARMRTRSSTAARATVSPLVGPSAERIGSAEHAPSAVDDRRRGNEPAPRTLIDATSLPTNLGGVGRYLEGLARGLAEDATADVSLIVKPEHLQHFAEILGAHRVIECPALVGHRAVRFAWEQLALPALARRHGAHVLHSPHYTFPFAAPLFGLRQAVTLHDATFFTDPAAHTLLKRVFFRFWVRRAMRRRISVIVPSASAGRELSAAVPGRQAAVTVALHGVDRERFHPPSDETLRAFGAAHNPGGEGWIAFLGTIEPRKRVGELVRAHRALRERRAAAGLSTPRLLISGARGWDADAIAELEAARAREDSGVTELGYLPLHELSALLGGATAVVYPSIAEGFGLPVLEAMACGAAVLTTRCTALPEVGGDAVAYCEPYAASIEVALDLLLDDSAERERRRGLALERAATFTWQRTASEHLLAYARSARA